MRDCVTPTRQSAREPVAAELVLQTSTLSLRTACLPPRAYGLWGMAGGGAAGAVSLRPRGAIGSRSRQSRIYRARWYRVHVCMSQRHLEHFTSFPAREESRAGRQGEVSRGPEGTQNLTVPQPSQKLTEGPEPHLKFKGGDGGANPPN